MPHVQVRPSKDLRNHYRDIANITKKSNPVIITSHGRGDTVLISMDDYAKYEDYLHHQYIINELKKAEQEAADPNTKWYTHDEVWNEIWARRRQTQRIHGSPIKFCEPLTNEYNL